MKQLTAISIGALVSMIGMLGLTGCANDDPVPECEAPTTRALIVLRDVTAHASVGIDPAVECMVTAALRAGVPVSVIAVDGDPEVTLHGAHGLARTDNDTVFHDDLPHALATIGAAFTPANDDGLDLLAALRMAADLSEDSTVLVISSGLQDVEPLVYPTPGMLAAEADELASQVLDSGALTDAGGIRHVTWFGAGYGAGKQGPLRDSSMDAVRATWASILDGIGTSSTFINAPVAETSTFTTASTVTPTLDRSLEPIAPQVDAEEAAWVFSQDGPVAFVANSTDYVEPRSAEAAIEQAAIQINEHGGCAVVVSGTTAEVPEMDRGQAQDLALARADAVVEQLMRAGTARECITVRGYAGVDSPWYIDDSPGGVFSPTIAVSNRTVRITATG